MGSFRFTTAFLLASLFAVACASTPAPVAEPESASDTEGSTATVSTTPTEEAPPPEPAGPPPTLPQVMVSSAGPSEHRPAIYAGPEEDAPRFGYLRPGVRMRVEGEAQNGRVEVTLAGALATRAWVPLERLALYAQRSFRLEGTRAYVGANDLVEVVTTNEDGSYRIRVRPWLGGHDYLGPFEGTVPADALADRPTEGEVEPLRAGECFTSPSGVTAPVYANRERESLGELPAVEGGIPVTVMRQGGGWFGARVGFGPYVLAYLQGDYVACGGPTPAPRPRFAPAEVADRPAWMDGHAGELLRVASGTRLQVREQTVARLRAEGWARRNGEMDGGIDVFVAVNDDVALRALAPAEALTPVIE
jgi:hypothetical protein